MEILLIIFAYMVGSFSPSYVLGRLKGIDIREHGTKNAGATNAWRVLGKKYGILTGAIDIAKGFVTVFISAGILQNKLIFLVYLATLLGHNYPFYLRRGGSGLAVTIGSGLAFLFTLPGLETITIYILLAFTIFYLLTRLVIYPFRYKRKKEVKVWRKVLRFTAIGLPLIYVYFGKNPLLWVVIPITLIFAAHDILRYFRPSSKLSIITKEKEKTISGMSYFMFSTLLVILFFEKDIAVLVMFFYILGDNFAGIFGIKYGKDKIIANKTVEGSFFFLASAFFGGYLFMQLGLVDTKFTLLLTGAFAGTLTELFSMKVDDNLTVPIITGLIMSL